MHGGRVCLARAGPLARGCARSRVRGRPVLQRPTVAMETAKKPGKKSPARGRASHARRARPPRACTRVCRPAQRVGACACSHTRAHACTGARHACTRVQPCTCTLMRVPLARTRLHTCAHYCCRRCYTCVALHTRSHACTRLVCTPCAATRLHGAPWGCTPTRVHRLCTRIVHRRVCSSCTPTFAHACGSVLRVHAHVAQTHSVCTCTHPLCTPLHTHALFVHTLTHTCSPCMHTLAHTCACHKCTLLHACTRLHLQYTCKHACSLCVHTLAHACTLHARAVTLAGACTRLHTHLARPWCYQIAPRACTHTHTHARTLPAPARSHACAPQICTRV